MENIKNLMQPPWYVKMRPFFYFIAVVFFIPQSKNNYRERSVQNIVELLLDGGVIKGDCWEARFEPVEEDWEDEEHVLVEVVHYEIGVFSEGFSTVEEDKSLEEFELAEGVVGCSGCLVSLDAFNPHPNMSCNNHINIISSIPNS